MLKEWINTIRKAKKTASTSDSFTSINGKETKALTSALKHYYYIFKMSYIAYIFWQENIKIKTII